MVRHGRRSCSDCSPGRKIDRKDSLRRGPRDPAYFASAAVCHLSVKRAALGLSQSITPDRSAKALVELTSVP